MDTEQDSALRLFRAEYGRMCVMAALALRQGHDNARISFAVCGHGLDVAPVYADLRSQRARLDVRSNRCVRMGVPLKVLTNMALETRKMVEAEWMVELPLFAGVKADA